MFLARDSRIIGLIVVRDTLKEFSKDAIDRLKAMGKEIKQNLFFSFFYNSLGIPIAAGLLYRISVKFDARRHYHGLQH